MRARSPRLPLLLVAAGLALLVVTTQGHSRETDAPVTLVGLQVQRTEAVALAPGATRAWPAGGGVAGVLVVSGRVAVHGSTGDRAVYGPGQGFAAGWEPYRIINETESPVELVVTFHAE
ncbi:MAG: hypothetical protein M3450_02695 [Actinomycetota bacterium]|nr:hypothetical protein [Actinomycetota bacterium]